MPKWRRSRLGATGLKAIEPAPAWGLYGAPPLAPPLGGGGPQLAKWLAWSDYVFDDDYQLRSLTEVEEYMNNHCHLPDVPSATDVCEQGQDLGKMNAILLRKIEELTLYVIELEKKLNGQ